MSGPYREDPYVPPPFDPWPFMRTHIIILWLICLGWFLFVGCARWFEFGHAWPAFGFAAYWLPTFPPYYFACRRILRHRP